MADHIEQRIHSITIKNETISVSRYSIVRLNDLVEPVAVAR